MTRKSALAAFLLLPSFSYAATVLSAPPELNNKSYVLMDYETGQILASKNENEKLAPASMTKMMTSFIRKRLDFGTVFIPTVKTP